MVVKILLWINISLFILHEMDAVKTREWKMLFLINRLNDNTGHIIFTALHFVLFIMIFYFVDSCLIATFLAVSILLIIHQFMHILFRKHSENRMNNPFSQTLIFLMFVNSTVSLVYYITILKN